MILEHDGRDGGEAHACAGVGSRRSCAKGVLIKAEAEAMPLENSVHAEIVRGVAAPGSNHAVVHREVGHASVVDAEAAVGRLTIDVHVAENGLDPR